MASVVIRFNFNFLLHDTPQRHPDFVQKVNENFTFGSGYNINKMPAMHRNIFCLQLTRKRRLIENLPLWQNAIYFRYNVKIRIKRNIFEPTLPL